MINITTLQGAKDILSKYSGDEYYVISSQEDDSIFAGHWLIKIMDVDEAIYYYREVYSMIAEISEDIICTLINEGYLVSEISEKEWDIQVALGTAPSHRRYLIRNKVEK